MTNRFARSSAERYLGRMDAVDGWLERFSARFMLEIARFQSQSGMRGAVAEIGVHHGKLFLLLYLSTQADEPAIAIDVFERQHLNLDHSGRGNKAVFLRAVDRHAGSREGLAIVEDSSLNLSAEAFIRQYGRVRLFSVDGGHTEEAVSNDLRLAEACMTRDGVLILDDCFNEYWPEVSWSVAKFVLSGGRLVPFAITPGKVLLCRAPMKASYQAMVQKSFPRHVDKRARLYGHEVLIVGVQPRTLRRIVGSTRLGRWLKRRMRPLGASDEAARFSKPVGERSVNDRAL